MPNTRLLKWDEIGDRKYRTGIQDVILFPISAQNTYDKGIAWNGVSKIAETPDGGEPTKIYADNLLYLTMYSLETLGGTITAYDSPAEFDECDGTAAAADGVNVSQQTRKTFGLAYKTQIGNDTQGNDYGYEWHLLYGCMAKPTGKEFSTINDSPEAAELSWEFTTTPVEVPGLKPSSLITIDSTKANATKLASFEAILYGTKAEQSGTDVQSRLPMPTEVLQHFAQG